MKPDLVRVLDGNIFVLSEHNGDIEATFTNPCGFFDFDTRFLSRWRLSLNGQGLNPLSVAERDHVSLRFFLVPGAPTHYVDAKSSVIRERSITGGAFEERLTVLNHDQAFEERPGSPYYGSADATPLYVILLDEYERWTGDADLVREFEDEARAALRWIDEYGDLLGDSYVRYRQRNAQTGVENQGWKDTPDAICHADGRPPAPPLATCELQGYAYDAKLRGARLARELWGDPAYAERLEREAAELRERFDRDFWIADRGYYALALDGDGRQVDGLASNMGHLLWSGIVPHERAARVVEQLMGPRLFSGWGVRIFAEGQDRYNPLGYHLGAVWPFDNALIAWGLRRYGFAEEAGRIAEGVIEAASYFDGRQPEAFAGYPRDLTHYPVRYPTANSPQAMATGAPFLLLRALLGLEPAGEHLLMAPRVPTRFGGVAGRAGPVGPDRRDQQWADPRPPVSPATRASGGLAGPPGRV